MELVSLSDTKLEKKLKNAHFIKGVIMAHNAGKGSKPRPFSISQEDYVNRLNTIFNHDSKSFEDDEDYDCPACGGPLYTQPHWSYTYCDDCGHRIKKEPMEP
jgi:DNA-directed RNA polymerase subunit RPC12/RpoP